MTPQEWFLRRLSKKYDLPVHVIKKIVNNNYKQLNQAFSKDGINSIEWVGIGKFLTSQVRIKKTIEKNISKIYGAQKMLEIEESPRLRKCIDASEKLIIILRTKLKDDKLIADLRRVEEQLAAGKTLKEIYQGGSRQEGEDL